MKEIEGEDFDYVLLCNKICGVSHYNMQMKFIVETQEEYDLWISSQTTEEEKQEIFQKKLVTQKL
jgi:cytochrome c oxidase subunit 2